MGNNHNYMVCHDEKPKINEVKNLQLQKQQQHQQNLQQQQLQHLLQKQGSFGKVVREKLLSGIAEAGGGRGLGGYNCASQGHAGGYNCASQGCVVGYGVRDPHAFSEAMEAKPSNIKCNAFAMASHPSSGSLGKASHPCAGSLGKASHPCAGSLGKTSDPSARTLEMTSCPSAGTLAVASHPSAETLAIESHPSAGAMTASLSFHHGTFRITHPNLSQSQPPSFDNLQNKIPHTKFQASEVQVQVQPSPLPIPLQSKPLSPESGSMIESNMKMERRQKRMIKNRESAAKSRERKQVYIQDLEMEKNRLQIENNQLKNQVTELLKENATLKQQLWRKSEALPLSPTPKGKEKTSPTLN